MVLAILAPHLCLAADLAAPLVTLPDPRAALKPETDEQRKARHEKVAQARAGTVLLVHRGAWEFGPENTLSAIRAAFELGCSGVELDFRRTKDGVIVLFHDGRLERLLDDVGTVEESYYEELLLATPVPLPMLAAKSEQVPTLRDALQLVRDHAGLLHLDMKVPGLDDELCQELQAADMLDHVVTYNAYNSEAFRKAGIPTMRFKGSLMDKGRDTEPTEARRLLGRPGRLLILDDPRATLSEMGKPARRVSPKALPPLGTRAAPAVAQLEAVLRGASDAMPVRVAAVRLAIYAPRRLTELATDLAGAPSAAIRCAVARNLGMIAKHRPGLISDAVRTVLLRLLRDAEAPVRAEAAVACGRARIDAAVTEVVSLLTDRPGDIDQWTDEPDKLRQRQVAIEHRARYAFALGLLGVRNPAVTGALVDAVKHRAVHRDLMLVGVDGAMAAWALGELRATEAVGPLREALHRNDPTLAPLSQVYGQQGQPLRPPGTWDFHLRIFILPALAKIGSDDARAVLAAVLDAPADPQGPLSPYVLAQAADALASFPVRDRAPILAKLLTHQAPEARRSAILACLKQHRPQCRALLESRAPWAVPWWDAQHGPR